ncbi:hypothetical protein AB6A40_003614 [Gnathostoma spinigerum]|uniref:Uncharacterized protein n=1 Tax=Gnathostoma spinigerum TaxID=75299 RepID=A0ABD6EKV8_9BILA
MVGIICEADSPHHGVYDWVVNSLAFIDKDLTFGMVNERLSSLKRATNIRGEISLLRFRITLMLNIALCKRNSSKHRDEVPKRTEGFISLSITMNVYLPAYY